jgi:hypothetical protein
MGNTIWVEVSNRPLQETSDDCSKLYHLNDQLEDMNETFGVPKLSEFYDWTKMNEAADDEMKTIEAIEKGEEYEPPFRKSMYDQSLAERQATGDWFDPAQVLITLQVFRNEIAKTPSAIQLPARDDDIARYRGEVLGEFEYVQQILARAAAEGQRFRFLLLT